MRVKSLVIGLGLVSLSALAACGSSNDKDTTEATASPAAASAPTAIAATEAAEAEYLAKVDAYVEQIDSMVESIGQALSQTWPVASRLFEVLGEANVSGTLETVLGDIEQLTPPDRFRADHERYVRGLRDTLAHAREHDQAIVDRDLLSVYLARSKIFLARDRALVEVSPALCRAATIPPRAATFCDTGDPLPGGQYGVELRSAFKRFVVEFGPRVSSFPQAFTPEERFAGLEVLQPEIERALEESIESISALEPPAEFQADHDRLIQYLEETLDTARAITAAAAARDFPKTQEQFARSGEVLCTAYTDLSHEFRSLVSFFFTPQACGVGP